MEHVLSVSLIREDKETESNVHQTNAVLLKSFYLMEPVIVVHNFKGHKEMETWNIVELICAMKDKNWCLMVHVKTVETIWDNKVMMGNNVDQINAIVGRKFWLMDHVNYVQTILL